MSIPRMNYPQYRKARKLTHECCNYCDGKPVVNQIVQILLIQLLLNIKFGWNAFFKFIEHSFQTAIAFLRMVRPITAQRNIPNEFTKKCFQRLRDDWRYFVPSRDQSIVWLHEEPGLAGAGTADHQNIFVSCSFGVFRPVVHGEPFRLCQQNVVVKIGVDIGGYILGAAP